MLVLSCLSTKQPELPCSLTTLQTVVDGVSSFGATERGFLMLLIRPFLRRSINQSEENSTVQRRIHAAGIRPQRLRKRYEQNLQENEEKARLIRSKVLVTRVFHREAWIARLACLDRYLS